MNDERKRLTVRLSEEALTALKIITARKRTTMQRVIESMILAMIAAEKDK